ncbi:hypothetical protein HYC85_021595 [Camellia sinensis]|uniref:Smr domain-containing protein n=1 Tax=Camellia sinensis TaxID=4442 RepID=A0A7J7GM24_CAMSI|nr:hypothetical protein HYC85_021595 [Camellia sinensis]
MDPFDLVSSIIELRKVQFWVLSQSEVFLSNKTKEKNKEGMSLSNKGVTTNDKKLNTRGKAMTLNPNAAEFIPFALRSSAGSTSTADLSTSLGASGTGTLGKAVIDRSESSISNNSDDEAHQFWRHQLPDDITPDFKVMGEDESLGINSIPFSTLSLHDGNETFRFSPSTGSGFILKEQHELSSQGINRNSFAEKMRYSVASYGEDASSANFLHLPPKPWGKPIVDNDQVLTTIREGLPYNGNSRQGMLNEQAIAENTEMNPLEFLASQFPGFAAESLAEVYVTNGGDLNLTIEMLTQLELQDDGGLNQNFNPKALSAPNLSALDFPVLSVLDVQNGLPKYAGDDIQQSFSPHRSASKDSLLLFKSNSSIPTRSTTDFASAVRKMSSQDSGIWKYDRNGSADASVGSSRTANVLASSYNGGRGIYGGDRLQSRSSSQAAPVWLETGEAVGNMYSEMRDEARDHAQLRNTYFEQNKGDVQNCNNYRGINRPDKGKGTKRKTETLSAIQVHNSLKKGAKTYLAALVEIKLDLLVEVLHEVVDVLREFEDVMPSELPKSLPSRRATDHEIELVSGARPPVKTPYRMSPMELTELQRQLTMLDWFNHPRPLTARQAYLFGNKALAKELTVKGQVHNMHLRAAHGKAQESIFRQRLGEEDEGERWSLGPHGGCKSLRSVVTAAAATGFINPVNPEIQGNGRGGGQERMIDLHGLHVSEALHVLKHELALLRSTAKSVEQRLQVYVCVGTGHHTRGSRTPVRLPIAVQRYLLEEEGLDYSEPQPGLLRVVIC